MQLQHWVHDSKNSFQHSLLATSSQIIPREATQLTYRAFVLDKHPDTMGSAFRQLLHNLGKVNGRKKVTPRVLRDFLHVFTVLLPIRKNRGPHFCVTCWTGHGVLRTYWLRILRKIYKAVPEEAMNCQNCGLRADIRYALVIRRIGLRHH